jgi:hypothetical protein
VATFTLLIAANAYPQRLLQGIAVVTLAAGNLFFNYCAGKFELDQIRKFATKRKRLEKPIENHAEGKVYLYSTWQSNICGLIFIASILISLALTAYMIYCFVNQMETTLVVFVVSFIFVWLIAMYLTVWVKGPRWISASAPKKNELCQCCTSGCGSSADGQLQRCSTGLRTLLSKNLTWYIFMMLCSFLICFFASLLFFKGQSTNISDLADQSRNLNTECLWGIWDHHDLWHLCSALTLFAAICGQLFIPSFVEEATPPALLVDPPSYGNSAPHRHLMLGLRPRPIYPRAGIEYRVNLNALGSKAA